MGHIQFLGRSGTGEYPTTVAYYIDEQNKKMVLINSGGQTFHILRQEVPNLKDYDIEIVIPQIDEQSTASLQHLIHYYGYELLKNNSNVSVITSEGNRFEIQELLEDIQGVNPSLYRIDSRSDKVGFLDNTNFELNLETGRILYLNDINNVDFDGVSEIYVSCKENRIDTIIDRFKNLSGIEIYLTDIDDEIDTLQQIKGTNLKFAPLSLSAINMSNTFGNRISTQYQVSEVSIIRDYALLKGNKERLMYIRKLITNEVSSAQFQEIVKEINQRLESLQSENPELFGKVFNEEKGTALEVKSDVDIFSVTRLIKDRIGDVCDVNFVLGYYNKYWSSEQEVEFLFNEISKYSPKIELMNMELSEDKRHELVNADVIRGFLANLLQKELYIKLGNDIQKQEFLEKFVDKLVSISQETLPEHQNSNLEEFEIEQLDISRIKDLIMFNRMKMFSENENIDRMLYFDIKGSRNLSEQEYGELREDFQVFWEYLIKNYQSQFKGIIYNNSTGEIKVDGFGDYCQGGDSWVIPLSDEADISAIISSFKQFVPEKFRNIVGYYQDGNEIKNAWTMQDEYRLLDTSKTQEGIVPTTDEIDEYFRKVKEDDSIRQLMKELIKIHIQVVDKRELGDNEQQITKKIDTILDEYISTVGEKYPTVNDTENMRTYFSVKHIPVDEKTRYFSFLGNGGGFVNANSTTAFKEKEDSLLLVGCGYDVLPLVREHLDKKYETVDIVVTHLHGDQVGSLASTVQFFKEKGSDVRVISPCDKISTYLDKRKISGEVELVNESNYNSDLWDLRFFQTEHVPEIDSYGFVVNDNNYIPNIIFVGPNSKKELEIPLVEGFTELYVEGAHGVNRPAHVPIENVSIPGNEGTRNVILTNITTDDISKLRQILLQNGLKYEVPGIIDEREIDS